MFSVADKPRRSAARYFGLACVNTLLGLGSRHYAARLPAWVEAYAGDALWALLMFWLAGLLRPKWPSHGRALAAGAFTLLIEISQLWQAAWLQAVRHTTLGALVLGQSFLWSDLVCYGVGIALGYGLDKLRAV